MALSTSSGERFEFRRVTTHLRPPRIAILVPDSLAYWQRACLSILEWTTRLWGGRYVPIVPTDGDSIDEIFWQILEAFDPDYLCTYSPDGKDVEDYDPDLFWETVDQIIDSSFDEEPTPEERRIFEQHVRQSPFTALDISNSLRSDLKRRLSPFHRDHHLFWQIKGRESGINNPFTDIADLITAADCENTVIHDLSLLPQEFQLMAASVLGRCSGQLRERTQAGLRAARARGKTGGRPAALSEDEVERAADLVADAGWPVSRVAELFDVHRSTLYRYVSPDGVIRRRPSESSQ